MSRRFRQLEGVDKLLSKKRRLTSRTSESSNTSKEESFPISPKKKDASEQVYVLSLFYPMIFQNCYQNMVYTLFLQVKSKWTNRERVLIFCSRGASYRMRHLMKDFLNLMPHSKSDNKMDKRNSLVLINEIAEIANCTKCLYFENRKHTDLYLWISNTTHGPSVKFLVHNVHTMDEMRMSGNCLKGSRPVLSFDSTFDSQPHFSLIKQLLMQTFSTPYHHPRSKPFIDHVFTFSITADGKIWFRNFQIVDETLELQEIGLLPGPRMVLEIIRIFDGSFEGSVLYDNPNYVSPNKVRSEIKKRHSHKYVMKKLAEKAHGI
uniref:Ribosome biogenesis protein BRX1 homolog n=1 Tax=Brugia timori TaxID=42155 RepID=A0A0R3QC08_9BILA